jgi:transcriptional regulator with XRE-family HTH domain
MEKNRIRELREESRMTQLRLSMELEVSQETVSAYESGKHFPSYRTLVKLAEIFGVGIDYLMGRSDVRLIHSTGLSGDEEKILTLYRSLDRHGRELAGAYIAGLAERQ